MVRRVLALLFLVACPKPAPVESVPPELLPPPTLKGKGPRERIEPAQHSHDHPRVMRDGRTVADAVAAADHAHGREVYDRLCASCHGTDGRGDGARGNLLPVRPRDFARVDYMRQLSPEHLYKVVRDGGASANINQVMKGFGDVLDDDDIADVLAYIRDFAGH